MSNTIIAFALNDPIGDTAEASNDVSNGGTLKEFRSSIRGTATEGVKFGSEGELVGEAKVCNLYVHVTIQQ